MKLHSYCSRKTGRAAQTPPPRRRGVAIVEFALALPVILALLMGIIEMGFLVKNQLTLSNATRDATRYAALGHSSSEVITRLKNGAAQLNPNITTSQIVLEQSADTTSATPAYYAWTADVGSKNTVPTGNLIRVRVAYQHKTLTGFFPFLNNRVINPSVIMLREANAK